MPSKTWGTPHVLADITQVNAEDEIPVGQYAYLTAEQTGFVPGTDYSEIPVDDWNAMMAGDFSEIAAKIQKDIPGTLVKYIRIHWTSAEGPVVSPGHLYKVYRIRGFSIEVLVKNTGGALTGLEIIAIIIAVAFIVAVLALVIVGAWTVYKVVTAAEKLGPAVVVVVGLIVLVIVIVALLLLLGVGFQVKGKKVGLTAKR